MDAATLHAQCASSGRLAIDTVPGKGPLRRLLALILVERRQLWRAGFHQAMQALSYLPFSFGVGLLIDHVLRRDDLAIATKGWLILAYLAANLLLWPVHSWFTVTAFKHSQCIMRATTARLRRMVVDQLQCMSLSFFTRKGAGAVSNQVTVDLGRVEGFLGNVTGSLVVSFTIGVASLAYLLVLNWRLAAVALLAVPVQLVVIRWMGARIRLLNRRVQQTNEDFSARIVEFISGMRLTKSFGNEDLVGSQMGRAIEEVRSSGLDASITMRWMAMWMQMMWDFTPILVWCLGGWMYLQGVVTFGELVTFTMLLGFVRQGAQGFIGAYDAWQPARPGMEALLELLDSQELEGYLHPRREVHLTGAITFERVGFRYPGSAGDQVLADLDLAIPPGQRIGLVGETGAGKSTFLDLVLGFYRPSGGAIRYDGHSLEDLGLRQLRRNTAIMSQDAFLWNASIRENIRFGRPGASDAEVEQAAKRAQAHDFILRTESGYDTLCGERGGELSGGQRQRLALARVFLRDPRFIVLDEPTSALDLETEARLQEDLDRLCAGRTTFIVAHRLSTLRNVDRILLFHRGRIAEDGPPAELLARPDGRFAHLHAIQGAKPG
jgi:ABC-type multidrug transport system fused ATPase/permease subunit